MMKAKFACEDCKDKVGRVRMDSERPDLVMKIDRNIRIIGRFPVNQVNQVLHALWGRLPVELLAARTQS